MLVVESVIKLIVIISKKSVNKILLYNNLRLFTITNIGYLIVTHKNWFVLVFD